MDMLHYETQAKSQGLRFIFGIDEAGRGPLAGPVVAAAVYLKTFDFQSKINDSKKMTAKARQMAFHEIFDKAYVGIGMISEAVIDEINILNAAHCAMDCALRHLLRRLPGDVRAMPDFHKQVILLVDGNRFSNYSPYHYQTIVAGDAKSLSIACASVVAKVTRDRIMDGYGRLFPQYGFGQHKGYPTESHRDAIRAHGPSRIHRMSFTLL